MFEDGVEQIVLKPDNKFEEGLLGKMAERGRVSRMHLTGFYQGQHNWMDRSGTRDLILVLTESPEPIAPDPDSDSDPDAREINR